DLSKAMLVESGARRPDAAQDGSLLVMLATSTPPKMELVWADREGTISPVPGAAQEIIGPVALSPDGKLASFTIAPPGPSLTDIVVRDLSSGTDTKLTFDSNRNLEPAWLPSGNSIVYTIESAIGVDKLMMRGTDGAVNARELVAGHRARISSN